MRHQTKLLTRIKPGPKVNLAEKAKHVQSLIPEGYRILLCGQYISTFKHSCGKVLEAKNYSVQSGRTKCPCQHKKLMLHTVQTLQAWHDDRCTGFKVLSLGGTEARLKCLKCKSEIVKRRFYDRRCPKCFTNIFASNTVTQKDYVKWVAENRPGFEVKSRYVNVRTKLEYLHLDCGRKFEAFPDGVARNTFRCPACAPKHRSSYLEFERNGILLSVRGKEAVALDWILDNTSYTLDDIVVDSEGLVPRVTYSGVGHSQTYRPDFYIKRSNLIVEVKDCTTLGLKNTFFYKTPQQLWKANCAKAKACVDRGYRFKLMLFDRNNKLIKLPSDWYLQSRTTILKLVKSKGVV
jgi:hypothetical protein